MQAFLIDGYERKNGIVLWFLLDNGQRHAIYQRFCPYFFIEYSESSAKKVHNLLYSRFGRNILITRTVMEDIIRGSISVLKIKCNSPGIFRKISDFIKNSFIANECNVYNIDVSSISQFFFINSLFPYCRCEVDPEKSDKVISLDNNENIDFEVPDIKIMKIYFQNSSDNPVHTDRISDLCIEYDEEKEFFSWENILEADEFIKRGDPDVIVCPYGDSVILRRFIENKFNSLNRGEKDYMHTKERSFFSYGKTVYKSGAVYLKGRNHIDPRNSFFYDEVGIKGMIELCRISCVSLQSVARTSPGTIITAIEVRKAFQQNILIPFRKSMPEGYKSAFELIKTDKGGLSYKPPVGLFRNVAELDFFSMYPSVMVNYNLSYETLECSHNSCKTRLPGIHYKVCSQKKGIIPQALEIVLERRRVYKERMRSSEYDFDEYFSRQLALKWLLVVSFGYLGYKNATFGRIECHEATTAVGRELLLEAKEVAEAEEYSVLHGLTDSIWVEREGAELKDFKDLENNINKHISNLFRPVFSDGPGFNMVIEGVFKWIVFLPSKEDGTGVANRFFGMYYDGSYKVRGIDIRRRDCPGFIKEFQQEVLDVLKNIEFSGNQKKFKKTVLGIMQKYEWLLIKNKISVEHLVKRKRMSKEINEYKKRTDIVECGERLIEYGVQLRPGQKINIVYVKERGISAVPLESFKIRDFRIDVEKYVKLLKQSYNDIVGFA